MEIYQLESILLRQQVALWNEAFSDYLVPAAMTEASFTARMEKLHLSAQESLVAKVDGEAAAVILTGTRNFKTGIIAWIGGLAVVPKFRKKGISRQLLEQLFVRYQEQGVKESRLEVISENVPALKLYEKVGYKPINELIYLTGNLQNYGVVCSRLEDVSNTAEYVALENEDLPWQNRITAHHKIATIWQDEEQLGYIVYSLSDDNLILLQVRLNHASTQILSVLQAFYEIYGNISCAVFNEIITSNYLPVLLNKEFKKVATQIQMCKEVQ
ncbi:GNAT family N-acetyltransferase [Listeria rocourtiae]|uniref:GNAT family N-acetyltransferase n=1 Tax=Listeria rocourtiae TaxID=647910 RepID=UPI001625B9B5|nr:GNAT family N-acetyltransferase [Listeria rocourtiae]MBC1434287.1 GNAT family N-acetyltransferase [Listeria rocourtiae]